jgi:uncharacterized NAD-dependent epimerase/dehydratase family protein
MLGRPRKLALLAEGRFTPLDAKTAVGVLRYRPHEVVAVIDRSRAGMTADACVGVGGVIPVVGALADAARLGADSLLIGIAPQGGELPNAWRPIVRDALENGWDVLAGLHAFLGDDPSSRRGAAPARRLIDVRRPPAWRPIAAARPRDFALVVRYRGERFSVEDDRRTRDRARGGADRAVAFARGRTGIFIADRQGPADAVPSDFVAGLIEKRCWPRRTERVRRGRSEARSCIGSRVVSLLHGAAPAA